MFVSINCETMKFLHKHGDMEVVCNLVAIEYPEASVLITPFDFAGFLADFTSLELRLLYANTTGLELAPSTYTDKRLRQLLASIADELPCTDATRHESDLQAIHAVALRQDGDVYSYVRGAKTPAKQVGLFEHPTMKITGVNPEALQPVKMAPVPVVKVAPTLTHTPKPVTPSKPTTAAPKAAPKGGVCARVWAIADSCWEASGKATDKNALAALRKNVVSNAEAEGINKSTGSVQFGHWQKARILTLS